MPDIILNGEKISLQQSLSLESLLTLKNIKGHYVATAVNGELVTGEERKNFILKNNDVIEVVTPTQGG